MERCAVGAARLRPHDCPPRPRLGCRRRRRPHRAPCRSDTPRLRLRPGDAGHPRRRRERPSPASGGDGRRPAGRPDPPPPHRRLHRLGLSRPSRPHVRHHLRGILTPRREHIPSLDTVQGGRSSATSQPGDVAVAPKRCWSSDRRAHQTAGREQRRAGPAPREAGALSEQAQCKRPGTNEAPTALAVSESRTSTAWRPR